MCKFCSNKLINQNLPTGKDYSEYNHLDSASYFLLGDCLHISPQYLGVYGKRTHSIFNIKIKYCPFCGKQLTIDDNDFDFDIKF